MTRQSSSQSHISQSPSESHQRPAQHKAHRHVVSSQRAQRNHASSKNLTKLNKAAQQVQHAQQAADKEARHHRRTHSGNTVSAPSSPRPGMKRNASSGGIVRANREALTQVNLRKNHSSGHLARQGQARPALKSAKSDAAPPKKSLAQPTSPQAHAAVHFDVGSDEDDEEGGDDGWTEESASQSPTTTRSNTRSNSVVLDGQHKLAERNMESNRGDPSQVGAVRQPPAQATQTQTLPDRTRQAPATNGSSSHHSRPPDADMITSRLLQRSASHTVPPLTTAVAATVGASADRHTLLSHSAGSTLVDTPGKDLVSRFMDGDGSSGTPHDGAYMSSRKSAKPEGGDLDRSKRNKSMPNVNGADTPNRTPSRSGATTPTNLPPSRTQQKLMLQRASSNIEPHKLIPVTLPRTGGPTFLQSGIHYNANGEGRLDPRLQQQFNHVEVEYNVVRRYRNPLADSIVRIQQIPGISRKTRIPGLGRANGSTTPSTHGASSLSTSFNDAGVETDGASSRRSARHSFNSAHERPRSRRDDGDGEGRQSFDSESGRSGNEAEDICRRLWESAEIMEAD
jgi:hypothetical protein